MMNLIRLAVAFLAVVMTTPVLAAAVQTDHVEAELIAEHQSLQGGTENWVALRLAPEPGWHVYWRNPGDSGLPTELAWTLPPGIEAGDIHWPYPHRESLGDLTNYGYGDPTLFLVPLSVSTDVGSPVALAAKASWLVCKDICIPGKAELSLELPGAAEPGEPDARWTRMFSEARAALPKAARDWPAQFEVTDGTLRLAIESPAAVATGTDVEFFPYAGDLVAHAAPQRFAVEGKQLLMSQATSPYGTGAPESVAGVLVVDAGSSAAQAWEIEARPGRVAAIAAGNGGESAPAAATAGLPAAWPAMLGLAVLGGLILNLMPCVFPVLSLKALSVMSAAAGDNASRHRSHALVYTLGVLASFAAIAGVLIALRAGGAAIGWGFQLQSPIFVAALVYIIFALGLSLSGLISFGTRWMGLGQRLTEHPGLAGSFFTGVLAVLVASPCTAPFMGTALGFALTQSAWVAMPVFLALGLGMALPFLLLGFVPALAARLPRPGAWMETFKQVLAFPMYLTAIWLLWVVGGLTSRDGMALVLIGLAAVAFGLWIGTQQGALRGALRWVALAGAAALLLHPALAPAPANATVTAKAGWEPWSAERVVQLRAEGRTVFIDFTADWCITCKVNERVALKNPEVEAAFAARNAVLMIGDWTRSDPAITEVLRQYGRSGVPLYLLSVAGAEPVVLPQLLSPDTVIDALSRAP